LNRKGQVFTTDSILALTVFIGVLAITLAYGISMQNSIDRNEESYFLKEIATASLNQLLYTPGTPANWETLASPNDINSIGLANKRGILESAKVSRLVDLNSSYGDAKMLLGAGKYDVGIKIERLQNGQELASFGTFGGAGTTVVSGARTAHYNNENVLVRVMVSG